MQKLAILKTDVRNWNTKKGKIKQCDIRTKKKLERQTCLQIGRIKKNKKITGLEVSNIKSRRYKLEYEENEEKIV